MSKTTQLVDDFLTAYQEMLAEEKLAVLGLDGLMYRQETDDDSPWRAGVYRDAYSPDDPDWHPLRATDLGERIEAHFEDLIDLRRKKAEDYTDENLYAAEDLGVSAWLGVMVRMSDKWVRLKNLATGSGTPNYESIYDTLDDLACYAVICSELLKEARCEG